MQAALLGERLTLLRMMLAVESDSAQSWSRAAVARAANLSPAAVARLEKHGTGTAASLTALLAYYRSQGVNLAWLLTPDNERIPRYAFLDAFQNGDVVEACDLLQSLRRKLAPLTQAAGVWDGADCEAMVSALSLTHERIYQALALLLPAIRFVGNETDLRLYQHYLPPVAATSSGWRSRAVHLLPLHYYDAGEAIPRCGVPYYYLTYQALPTQYSSSISCAYCALRVDDKDK